VRHISAGAPKRSHFASRRQNSSSNHINEISTTSIGTNGTAKKRVSFGMFWGCFLGYDLVYLIWYTLYIWYKHTPGIVPVLGMGYQTILAPKS